MTPRRIFMLTVALCALGALLVLFAAGRTWLVEVTPRPAPLPEARVESTGGDLRPWLPALGWVSLAGAGALLATRGLLRRLVGGLLVLAGLAMLPAAIAGLSDSAVSGAAPLGVLVGAAAVVGAGATTIVGSRAWPAMGARYERDSMRAAAVTGLADRAAPDGVADRSQQPGEPPARQRPEDLWAALDQGEDPTSR